MAATKRKPAPKSLPRRTPDFVRPYLTRDEVAALVAGLQADPRDLSAGEQSALLELSRWAAL